ncbi:hypothetical protein V8E51_017110 [Hyaloscypha variabilis]
MSSSPLSSPPPSSSPTFESRYPVLEDTITVKDHPLVVSRLRPQKRKVGSPPLLVTPTRKGKRNSKRRRNSSSPPPPLSSLYRIRTPDLTRPGAHLISSPYSYDEEFYSNGIILNRNLNEESATYGAAYNRYKKHLRKAHEDIINSAKLDPFKPLNMPNPPRLIRSHLLDSCQVDDPTSYFDFFIRQRTFKLIYAAKIKVYFALLIFIDIPARFDSNRTLLRGSDARIEGILYYSGTISTEGIVEVLHNHPTLTPIGAGVLTLALNLPCTTARGEELKYTIFTDNLFTSYELFSVLRSYGIAGEIRTKVKYPRLDRG